MARSPRLWQNLWVRLAVALAFADASIVVLALPQIVDRLHTSIEHSTWVIMAYNLALIAGCAAVLPVARRIASRRTLVAGLGIFGAASLACGAVSAVNLLIGLRAVQGFGGALVVCASLPMFAGAAREGDSPLIGWSAAAAIGAAVGPAAGGILTQVFDWRSIFFFQAPVAVFAAAAVFAAHGVPGEALDSGDADAGDRGWSLSPLSANVGLTLFSAGLIGALFLVVIELINAWLLSPIAAAAVVSTIPIATAVAERVVRGRSAILLGVVGAILLALGLFVCSLANYRDIGVAIGGLALCGIGLGLGFPGLTAAALQSAGSLTARAAKTVAARDLGIVIGLLVLVPVFVNRINGVSNAATNRATGIVLAAPLPLQTKLVLGVKLRAAVAAAPTSKAPKIHTPFNEVRAGSPPSQRPALDVLERQLDAVIKGAVTPPFKTPLRDGALFALGVIPVLALLEWLAYVRRRRGGGEPSLSVR